MNNKIKNKESGFLQIIILIIIALLAMKYFGITITGVIDWFMTTFNNVFK